MALEKIYGLNLIIRKHQKGHIEGHSTLLQFTLPKIQGPESEGKTGELFQTQGHEETRQLNATHASEQHRWAIQDSTDKEQNLKRTCEVSNSMHQYYFSGCKGAMKIKWTVLPCRK